VSNVLADKRRRREAAAQAQRIIEGDRPADGIRAVDPDDRTLGVPAAAGMG
jgi:hypothetical protein